MSELPPLNDTFEGLTLHYVGQQAIGCTIHPQKMRLPEDAFLIWGARRLKEIVQLRDNLPFILGSFCNQMRKRSQKWEQILPDLREIGADRALKTLVNYSSIMDKYTLDDLQWALKFSYYREVAYVQPRALRQELLATAWREKLTVDELRALKPKAAEDDTPDDETDSEDDMAGYISRASVERFARALVDILSPETINTILDDMRQMIEDQDALSLVAYIESQLKEKDHE